MYGCTVCNNRKSVLNTEQEFDIRRRKPNTEEMQTYGVSNYCSACQRDTFFVNLLDFEDPLRLRGPFAWNIICAAAEKLGKIPLQPAQDAEVQTRSSDIFREALAPPASRERAGQVASEETKESKESSVDLRIRETAIQLNVESEESSSSLSAIDSRTTGIINSILYSETDSGTSRKIKDIKVLYRRPSNLDKDRQSSTRKISGVGHVSARLVPSGGLLLQRKMMEMRKQRKIEEKRKRLEELDSIMCRIQAKTTTLRTEMLALGDNTQQEETVERKSRRQREVAGALVDGNSWWGRENLERVFGKWSPERRDSKMEEGADILMQAIQENSGSKEQKRHTDQKDKRTRKESSGVKHQESHRDPSGNKDHRSRKDEKDLSGVTDRRSKKDEKDPSGVTDRRSKKDEKDLSGVTDRRSRKDQKDERAVKDQKAVKDHRETDIDEPWSMHNLYIHMSPPVEYEDKGALLCDSNSFRDNERIRNLLESPKAKPQTMRICREPLTCPICPECQQRCFVSDFNTHVQRDHPNVMLERISVGQTKTFHLDLRLTKKNQPMCHTIYFVKDMIIDPQVGHMQDLLPVLVMTARIDTCDVASTKGASPPEDEAMQLLLVWLCSYRPTNDRVIGTLSVKATCAELADSLTMRTARAYDIRAPQDMRPIFCSSSTLIVPYNFVRRISKRGNHSLTVSVKIE